MAEVDLDEEVIELSAEEPRSDNTNEIATKDFMNGERSRESIHNHWQFSDEGKSVKTISWPNRKVLLCKDRFYCEC